MQPRVWSCPLKADSLRSVRSGQARRSRWWSRLPRRDWAPPWPPWTASTETAKPTWFSASWRSTSLWNISGESFSTRITLVYFVSFVYLMPSYLSCVRTWLSGTDIKHKIITFEPKILQGKISSGPQQSDLEKPVIWSALFFFLLLKVKKIFILNTLGFFPFAAHFRQVLHAGLLTWHREGNLPGRRRYRTRYLLGSHPLLVPGVKKGPLKKCFKFLLQGTSRNFLKRVWSLATLLLFQKIAIRQLLKASFEEQGTRLMHGSVNSYLNNNNKKKNMQLLEIFRKNDGWANE